MPSPRPALKIADRYLLLEQIAAGGMGTVHVGRVLGAQGFARTVAIKRLHPQFAADPEFSAMLLDEARIAGCIRHPNVVPTLDVVQADGELFMVMEYVLGESLARLLVEARRASLRPSPPISVAILVGSLAGLHAAHEAVSEEGLPLEIVHRDVSPQNILVGRDGVPRIVDFGIARATVRAQVTREGQIKGKLRYMAPEQLRGRGGVDRRVDVYAAGVVLWEVLTGAKLFRGESDGEVFANVLEGVVEPPSQYADVSPALDAVVLRALARAPEARFPTAIAMAMELQAALSPASSAQVGFWVEQLVAPILEGDAPCRDSRAPDSLRIGASMSLPPRSLGYGRARPMAEATHTLTQTVAEPKGRPGDQDRTPPPLPPPEGPLTTEALPLPQRSFGSALRLAAAVTLTASIAASATFALRRRVPAAPSAAVLLPSAAVLLTQPSAALSSVELPTPTPEALRPAESATPVVPPTATASSPLAARPPRAPSRCSPAYYVDAAGIRRVKRECL